MDVTEDVEVAEDGGEEVCIGGTWTVYGIGGRLCEDN